MIAESRSGFCPSITEIKAFAEKPCSLDFTYVAVHLFVCDRCLREFERILYPAGAETLEYGERKTIEDFVGSHCRRYDPFSKLRTWVAEHPASAFGQVRGYWRLVAGTGTDSNKPVVVGESLDLVYVSDFSSDATREWRAELSLPATVYSDTMLTINVVGPKGVEVESGMLIICSQRIEITHGCGHMSYQSFVAGLRDSVVTLVFPDGYKSKGALVLF